jgi:hypothetical protein
VSDLPDTKVLDLLPDEPLDGQVCEMLHGGRVYVFVGRGGSWWLSDSCVGDFKDHGEGVVSMSKERSVYT